jgi:adenylate cyclase
LERRLAAILAADVAGYSRMMEADEAATLARLKTHIAEIIRPKVGSHHGTVVKTTGDGFLAEFASVVEAVECAVEIQRAMAEANIDVPDDRKIRFRIGINIGDIVIDEGDIFGDGVNIASRIEGLAAPGGIWVHRDVRSQVRNRLPLTFEDMGEVEVKNIARPLRVYKIVLDGSQPAQPAATPPAAKPRTRRSLAVTFGALVVVLLVGVGALVFSGWNPLRETPERTPIASVPTDKPSIAVLPFANMSSEVEQQYFADGLTEDLTTRLSSVSGLFVIARSSVQGYAAKTTKPQEVGRDLGVRYVLDGSVRKSGDRLRINANLVEAENAHQVWAEQYDRELTDIFALQDEVIGHIVSALAIKLTAVEEKQIARVPTENLEAYDYYLRAETEGYYRQDSFTYIRALNFYSKAIELDPKFADAYAGYARVAVEVWRNNSDQALPAPVARKRAYDAAGKALELDPTNARAHTVLAFLQLSDGRHEEAIASGKRAVELNPNDAEAHANLGMVLSFAGRPQEAIATIGNAMRLNPVPPAGLRLLAGMVFFNAQEYDRAIAELEPVVKAWPDAETPREYLSAAYALNGDTERARLQREALPGFSQANLAHYRLAYSDQYELRSDLEHLLKGLAAAGIPAWPFGFEGDPKDRVTGEQLEAISLGKTWEGYTPLGDEKKVPFILQVDAKSRVAYRGANTFLTGQARIENDQICMRFDGYYKGGWLCGDVFRDGAATTGTRGGYVYVLPDGLRYFLIKS